jgi:integrase
MAEEDIKTLMTLAKKNPRDYALLKLMASTGLRVSDVVRLKRDQIIDSDGDIVRIIRIKMAKTDKWIERFLRDDRPGCYTELSRRQKRFAVLANPFSYQ